MQQKHIEKKNKHLKVYLANPRGFCAGVERAIAIVEKSLEKYGAPIYIKHEIVHNKYVVDSLRKKGAIFVEDVAEVPENSLTIYSAHGVSQQVEDDSKAKNLKIYDATCPLVKKVHSEIVNLDRKDKQIILIGHDGHPEVEGTSGRIQNDVILVETVDDAKNIKVKDPNNLAFTTQTTLSVDDTKEIINVLKERFPNIIGPSSDDICYATQNRQDAVKALVEKAEILLVVGAQNSSNSNRLRDIGEQNNIPSYLILGRDDLDLSWFEGKSNVAITAGASAPEILIDELLEILKENFIVEVINVAGKQENIAFNLPKELRE